MLVCVILSRWYCYKHLFKPLVRLSYTGPFPPMIPRDALATGMIGRWVVGVATWETDSICPFGELGRPHWKSQERGILQSAA
jgi:hypothetical protein